MYHLSQGVQRRSRCYWQDHPCRGKARAFTARCPGHADRGVHIEAASHGTEKGKQPHNLRMCREADNTPTKGTCPAKAPDTMAVTIVGQAPISASKEALPQAVSCTERTRWRAGRGASSLRSHDIQGFNREASTLGNHVSPGRELVSATAHLSAPPTAPRAKPGLPAHALICCAARLGRRGFWDTSPRDNGDGGGGQESFPHAEAGSATSRGGSAKSGGAHINEAAGGKQPQTQLDHRKSMLGSTGTHLSAAPGRPGSRHLEASAPAVGLYAYSCSLCCHISKTLTNEGSNL